MNWEAHIESFAKLNVLVVGDVMLDVYLRGSVDRISPEAPVPVLLVKEQQACLGGAANVALNCTSLGAQVWLSGLIGVDAPAQELKQLLAQHQIHDALFEDASRPTTTKTRLVSGAQQLLRYDFEEGVELSEALKTDYLKHLIALIEHKQFDVIIFEDYDKGALDAPIIKSLLKKAHGQGIFTAVDPKKRNFNAYQGVSLFKPNLKEVIEGLGQKVEPKNLASLKDAATHLHQKMKVENVLITLSKDGIYFSNQKSTKILPAFIRNISDVSGAGDTVISVATLSMAAHQNIEIAAFLANLAGGYVCEKQGVVAITANQLTEEVYNISKKHPFF